MKQIRQFLVFFFLICAMATLVHSLDDRTTIHYLTSVSVSKGSYYPITFSIDNKGGSSKTYDYSVEGTENWASYYFEPNGPVTIDPNATRSVILNLMAKNDTYLGNRTITLIVKYGSDFNRIEMNVDVKEPTEKSAPFDIKIMIRVFIVLLVAAVIWVLLFIFYIFMVKDVIIREFNHKLAWLIVMNLVPLGYVFYYFFVKRPNKNNPVKKEAKIDTLSLVSFLLGAVATKIALYFGILLGIPAAILGFISRDKFNNSKNLRGKELATAGIVLGIVGFVMIFIFIIVYFMFFIWLGYSGMLK
jgi:hypothetical protein